MLDHEQLLVPISEESPCGEDLSFSAEFDAIADARHADDPTLDQGAWQTEIKTADWPAVIELGDRLLQEPLRAQLQECPPANTVEGIKCRQEVCEGYRGEAPACPAPQDVANGQRQASSAATQ